jgi:hypothetical protein
MPGSISPNEAGWHDAAKHGVAPGVEPFDVVFGKLEVQDFCSCDLIAV